MSYVVEAFFNDEEEIASLNLSRKHLAKMEAFKNVALTVAKQCRPRHPYAARFYILTLGALTRYKLVHESLAAFFSSSSSSWHPLPALTEFLEALASLPEMPAMPEANEEFDAQLMHCCILPIKTAIAALRKQGRKKEAAEVAVHVLPFVERSKIVALAFKINFVTNACDWIIWDAEGHQTVS
jgi:hypothetical protein